VNEFTGTVVVTGASSGIGLAGAVAFAAPGVRIGLVGRDPDRLAQAVERVRAAAPDADVKSFRADFASLAGVRDLAGELRDAYPHIDVLANNAGGAFQRRGVTADGHERTIQLNHLAPFLLTNLLLPLLRAAPSGRIVNVASTAGRIDPADLDWSRDYGMFAVYGSAKQANIMFAAEAARRWPEVRSYSYHPGVVRTRFGRDRRLIDVFYKVWPFLLSPEQGADTMRWLATAPDLTNGGYYSKRKLRTPTESTRDERTAAALWEASTEVVAEFLTPLG